MTLLNALDSTSSEAADVPVVLRQEIHMSEYECLHTVQRAYQAMAQGDVTVFLDALSDDVDVEIYGPPAIPFAGQHRGRRAVAVLLDRIENEVQIREWEVSDYLPYGDMVIVFGHEQVRIRDTGGTWDSDWIDVLTLCDRKVVSCRHYYDTATVLEAYREPSI